jgi:hypothetical protein
MERTAAELSDFILQTTAAINILERARLSALAEYDRRELWKADGATSMAAWVTGMLGFGRDTAGEVVRVATAFEELPKIAETFEEGALSFDQARAVTAFANPTTDEHLASEARKFSAGQLRRMAQRFRPVLLKDSNENHDARALKMRWDVGNRVLKLSGQLPDVAGRIVEKALDRFMESSRFDPGLGPYDHDARRADALVGVCSAAMAADPDADRATIGVHVDARVLAGEAGMAELDNATAIAIETAQRLACDSRWYVVVDGPDGVPLGIGRVSRSIPPYLAREIRHRDGGCRFVGCERKLWANIHHKEPWAKGGRTDMDNLVTLCGPHHRLVHEGGWAIRGDPSGRLEFVSPDGRVFREGGMTARPEVSQRMHTAIAAPTPALVGGPAP